MFAMPPKAHRGLIARLPLIGAKSLRIQNHDRSDDEREKLGREAQFETGLTGTPYAAALPGIIVVLQLYKADLGVGVKPI